MKVAELKVELKWRDLSKNGKKAVLCNQLLKSVVNNQPILNAGVEVNKAVGMKVSFPNPEDGWILGLRLRELHLKKDQVSEVFDSPVFAGKTTVW